jgi:hypothetical protein
VWASPPEAEAEGGLEEVWKQGQALQPAGLAPQEARAEQVVEQAVEYFPVPFGWQASL